MDVAACVYNAFLFTKNKSCIRGIDLLTQNLLNQQCVTCKVFKKACVVVDRNDYWKYILSKLAIDA